MIRTPIRPRPQRLPEGGFTLAELLVAVAIIGLVLAGLLGMLMTGQTSYQVGSNQVEAQQSIRLALDRVVNEIRNAGYCPTCGTGTTPFEAITSASATGFTIQNDWNGDWNGSSGISSSPVTDPDGNTRGEQIVYAVSGGALTRQEVGIDGSAVTLASGITSATFTYLDKDGNVTATPSEIRRIDITVTAQPQVQPAATQQGRVQVTMTDSVRLRNRAQ